MATALAGLRGTGEWPSSLAPETMTGMLIKTRRAGMAPIFALTEKGRNSTITTPTFEWTSQKEDVIILEMSAGVAAGDTLLTVTGDMPDTTDYSKQYGSAKMLKPGDILRVQPSTESASYDDELVLVEQVLGDTSLVVKRGFAGTTAASISSGQKLLFIGSAYSEGSGGPRATSLNPDVWENYVQIFKESAEITTEEDIANAKANIKSRMKFWADAMFKMSQGIEHAIMFGKKSSTVGSNGKPLRTMDGLRAFIPSSRTTIFSSAVTTNSLIDAIAPVFEYKGTAAGDERIMYVGNQAAVELMKIFTADSNTDIIVDQKEEAYGVKFTTIRTILGDLYMKTHPLMTGNPLLSKSAFIIDYDAIEIRYLKGFKTKIKKNVQNADEDLIRDLVITKLGLQVHHGGLTMGYLGNISAT